MVLEQFAVVHEGDELGDAMRHFPPTDDAAMADTAAQ